MERWRAAVLAALAAALPILADGLHGWLHFAFAVAVGFVAAAVALPSKSLLLITGVTKPADYPRLLVLSVLLVGADRGAEVAHAA